MKTKEEKAKTLRKDLTLNFIASPSNIWVLDYGKQLVVVVIIEHYNDMDDVYTISIQDDGYYCIEADKWFKEEYEILAWFL